jgi:hypothetical protein
MFSSIAIALKKNTSSNSKKSALGFLHFEKSNSGKRHCFLDGNRKIKQKKFPRFGGLLKKLN